MTELHPEGWKGWAYEYQNSWAICDVNRILQSDWSRMISCGRQNLVLVCNLTIRTHDMLGSAQLPKDYVLATHTGIVYRILCKDLPKSICGSDR